MSADHPTYVAECPECGGTAWELVLDGPEHEWGAIDGTACINCGLFIGWTVVEDRPNDKPEGIH